MKRLLLLRHAKSSWHDPTLTDFERPLNRRGRVAARRFRGDHVLLLIDVPGAPPLHMEAREGDLPSVGDDITLDVLPGGIHLIDELVSPADDASAVPSSHD